MGRIDSFPVSSDSIGNSDSALVVVRSDLSPEVSGAVSTLFSTTTISFVSELTESPQLDGRAAVVASDELSDCVALLELPGIWPSDQLEIGIAFDSTSTISAKTFSALQRYNVNSIRPVGDCIVATLERASEKAGTATRWLPLFFVSTPESTRTAAAESSPRPVRNPQQKKRSQSGQLGSLVQFVQRRWKLLLLATLGEVFIIALFSWALSSFWAGLTLGFVIAAIGAQGYLTVSTRRIALGIRTRNRRVAREMMTLTQQARHWSSLESTANLMALAMQELATSVKADVSMNAPGKQDLG